MPETREELCILIYFYLNNDGSNFVRSVKAIEATTQLVLYKILLNVAEKCYWELLRIFHKNSCNSVM